MNKSLNINLEEELGFGGLPLDQQKALTEKIGGILFKAVLARAIELLNTEEKEDLETILNSETSEADTLLNFLGAKVSNLDEIIQEEVAEFKKEGSEFLKALK